MVEIAQNFRILVVDEVEDDAATLARFLRATPHYSVDVVTDARLTVSRFRTAKPDLVILDLEGGSDGADSGAVLERLHREIDGHPFVPIMVVTSDASGDAFHRVFDQGASDYLTKPLDTLECRMRVRNLLHLRSLSRELERQHEILSARVRDRADEKTREASRRLDTNRKISDVIASASLRMVFQPIFELGNGSLAGFEALARFLQVPIRTPDQWFDEAFSVGRGTELEMRAIELAIAQLDHLPRDAYLTVNASPTTVRSPALRDLFAASEPSRLVVELTEHERVDDSDPLVDALDALRAIGVRLAVDDSGAGFAGLQYILRLRPDIIKLDRYLIVGAGEDPVRRSLTTALVEFSTSVGATVLAEGIESEEELVSLRELGVSLGQGYYLGMPAPLPARARVPAPAR